MEPTNIVHGVPFVRTGECNRCGACCEEQNYPHFSWDAEHKMVCSIGNTLTEICKICTKDEKSGWYDGGNKVIHQQCAEFPNHPWLNVIKNKQCGYTFTEIKTDGISIKSRLDTEWVK